LHKFILISRKLLRKIHPSKIHLFFFPATSIPNKLITIKSSKPHKFILKFQFTSILKLQNSFIFSSSYSSIRYDTDGGAHDGGWPKRAREREREREEMWLLDLYSLYNIVWEFIKPETEKHRINQEIHG